MSSRVLPVPQFPVATLKLLIEEHLRRLSFIHDNEDVVSMELKIGKDLADIKVHLTNPNAKGKVIHLV